MSDSNQACDCCSFPPEVHLMPQSRWVQCCFSPCGVQSSDPEDKTFYSVVTFTSWGYIGVTTYSRDEKGYCKSELTSCSGTTTITGRMDLTYDPDFSFGLTGGSGHEEIVSTYTYTFDADAKTCNWAVTATGISEIHVTWEPSGEDFEGYVDPGKYDCSRTYDGLTWTGPTGNSCLRDWEYRDLFTSYYPGFSAESSESRVYDPDPGETPTTEYSGPLTPTCDFPDFGPWPDENADSELPPLGPCQSRGRNSGFAFASQELDTNDNPVRRKFQFRIRHSPSGSCYLKVWFRKTTTIAGDPEADPPVADTVTHDDSAIYEWEGSGNPCLPDKTKRAEDPANLITGDPFEVLAPELGPDGRLAKVTVRVLKFSYLRDYEPDVSDPENPQPNGWPDPEWEPAAP